MTSEQPTPSASGTAGAEPGAQAATEPHAQPVSPPVADGLADGATATGTDAGAGAARGAATATLDRPATDGPGSTPSPRAPGHAAGGRSAGPLTLDPGLLVALVGAVLTFLAAFLSWATTDARSSAGSLVGGGTVTRSGLEGGHLGLATLVLSLLAVVLVVLLAMPATRPWGWLALAGAGGLTVVLAVIDAVAATGGSDLDQQVRAICAPRGVTCSASTGTGVGVWLTMVGGLLVAAGAVVHHRARRPATGTTAGTTIDTGAGQAAGPTAERGRPRPTPDAPAAAARPTPVGTVTRHPLAASDPEVAAGATAHGQGTADPGRAAPAS